MGMINRNSVELYLPLWIYLNLLESFSSISLKQKRRVKIILATSCEFFKNANKPRSKRRKVLFAWIVSWFRIYYIKRFPRGHL